MRRAAAKVAARVRRAKHALRLTEAAAVAAAEAVSMAVAADEARRGASGRAVAARWRR